MNMQFLATNLPQQNFLLINLYLRLLLAILLAYQQKNYKHCITPVYETIFNLNFEHVLTFN